jgi:hypothetical protein
MWVPQNSAPQPDLVEDLILDETHGLIAPITELPEPTASRYPEDLSSGLSSPAEEGVSTPGVQAAPTNNEERITDTVLTNPRTSPRPPKRVYTDEEKDFLKWTTSSTHYAPVHRRRPGSITDDDIIAAINANRRRCSLGPIDTDPNWNRATLSTGPVHPPASRYPEASASALASRYPEALAFASRYPEVSAFASRYPEASASGLSSAAQEEGALAPGVSNSRTPTTLPTLQAVAAPTYHWPLTTRLSPPAGCCKAHRPQGNAHPSNPPRAPVVPQTHFGQGCREEGQLFGISRECPNKVETAANAPPRPRPVDGHAPLPSE